MSVKAARGTLRASALTDTVPQIFFNQAEVRNGMRFAHCQSRGGVSPAAFYCKRDDFNIMSLGLIGFTFSNSKVLRP